MFLVGVFHPCGHVPVQRKAAASTQDREQRSDEAARANSDTGSPYVT